MATFSAEVLLAPWDGAATAGSVMAGAWVLTAGLRVMVI